MKRVNLFFIAAFVAASSLLVVSCGEETEEDNPTVEVKATYGLARLESIEDGGEIKGVKGTAVVLNINYIMGKSKLVNVKMLSGISGRNYTVLDSALNQGLFNFGAKDPVPFVYYTNIGGDEETLTLSATDAKNRITSFSLKIKTEEPAQETPVTGDAYTYAFLAETSFGCQSAAPGSFYNISGSKVMNITAARTSPNDVDLAFYYSGGACVGCPNDGTAGAISYGQYKMSSWSQKNKVYFKIVAGSSTSPSLNDAWWGDGIDGSTSTNATGLRNNDVVFFKKDGSATEGAFIVVSAAGAANGETKVKFIERKSK